MFAIPPLRTLAAPRQSGTPAPTPATVALTDSKTDAANLTVYTFSSCNLGAAASDRYIVVTGQRRPSVTLSSVTVGGITATIIGQAAGGDNAVFLAIAAVPTGTTGDVVVTFGSGTLRCAIQVYRLTGIATPTTPHDTLSVSANPATGGLDVLANGVAVGAAVRQGGAGCTWTGLTEDVDVAIEVMAATSASQAFSSTETNRTITADYGAGANLFAASWGPAA